MRWVEVNKGDHLNPKMQSRLVAREIRLKGEEAIVAPTPPFELLTMVLSHETTQFPNVRKKVWDGDSPDRQMIYFMDISRASFNAKVDEDDPAYVELPPEIDAPPGMCTLLTRHMYGTLRAADGWQSEYSGSLIDFGSRYIVGMHVHSRRAPIHGERPRR